jgi:hypothetical protein
VRLFVSFEALAELEPTNIQVLTAALDHFEFADHQDQYQRSEAGWRLRLKAKT